MKFIPSNLAFYSLLLVLASTPSGQSVEHPPSFESYDSNYPSYPSFETPETAAHYDNQQHFPRSDYYYHPSDSYDGEITQGSQDNTGIAGYGVASLAPIIDCGYRQLRDRNGICRRQWNLYY